MDAEPSSPPDQNGWTTTPTHQRAESDAEPGGAQTPWTSQSWTESPPQPPSDRATPPSADSGPAGAAGSAAPAPAETTPTSAQPDVEQWNVIELEDDELGDHLDDPAAEATPEPVYAHHERTAGTVSAVTWKPSRRISGAGAAPAVLVALACAGLLAAAVFLHPQAAEPPTHSGCAARATGPATATGTPAHGAVPSTPGAAPAHTGQACR